MVIAVVVGYLLGSFPTAVLVGRRRSIDPRRHGDGNPGWWNMRGLMGDGPASVVLAVDLAKGVAAGVVGSVLWGPWWVAPLAVLAAMVGHAFPVFSGFRGGRSVLTFVGGMAVLCPPAVAVPLASGLVVAVGSRRLLFGTRLAVLGIPVVQALLAPRSHVVLTLSLMAFIGARFLVVRAPLRSGGGVEPAV